MKDLVTQGGPRSLYRCFLKILLILVVIKRADVKDDAVVLIMLILTSSADYARCYDADLAEEYFSC